MVGIRIHELGSICHAHSAAGGQGMASRSKRLRELIAAPEILVLPGAWDGLSAILIEQAGFMVTQGGKTPYVPTDELERMGYAIIIFTSDVQRAAIFGMHRLLQELREQRTGEFFPDTVGFQEREGIINSDYYFQLQERYLRLD
jgi:2-methylisocitrate lyase-like PEP mutase family enzyme